MNIHPKIIIREPTFVVGLSESLNFYGRADIEIWKKFMPDRNKIQGKINDDIYSIQIYPEKYFDDFNPDKNFTRWAAVEVENDTFENLDFEKLLIPAGKYAVFNYKGLSGNGAVFEYIFKDWLPNSNFEIDNRPHFEILGEKFKVNDPESEEDIWIPIKKK